MTFEAFMKREAMTMTEVARRSGVPFTTVWRFINGESRVAANKLKKLVAITKGDVSLDEIVRELEAKVAAREREARAG